MCRCNALACIESRIAQKSYPTKWVNLEVIIMGVHTVVVGSLLVLLLANIDVLKLGLHDKI